jgi:Flp pilus assembly protein, protease CpaA
LIAAVGDMRKRRIPNRLVAILAVFGFAFSVYSEPILPGAERALEGILVGFSCWILFYTFGWLGAGDVKLFAAAAGWLGPGGAIKGSVLAALFGAVLSLAWVLRQTGIRNAFAILSLSLNSPGVLAKPGTALNVRPTLPYAVAIALGAISAAWAPGFLFGH